MARIEFSDCVFFVVFLLQATSYASFILKLGHDYQLYQTYICLSIALLNCGKIRIIWGVIIQYNYYA